MNERATNRLGRRRYRVIVSSLLALGFIAVSPATALAASWSNISGTTWSYSTEWFYSSNMRTKDGAGAIQAKFSVTPTLSNNSNDQLKFGVANWGNNNPIGSFKYFYPDGIAQTLASSVANGTQFKTFYARYTTCTSGCTHTFSGQLYY